jgi:hypothetical protein
MKSRLFFQKFFHYLLIFLVFFLSAGALFGGYMLLSDPSGSSLKMPITALANSPFSDFVIPGLILFIFMGLIPLTLVYALIARPAWHRANFLNIYKTQHWSWTYTLYVSIILVIWIDVQIWFLGYGAFIQTLYALLGIFMIIITLIPSNMHYYAEKGEETI